MRASRCFSLCSPASLVTDFQPYYISLSTALQLHHTLHYHSSSPFHLTSLDAGSWHPMDTVRRFGGAATSVGRILLRPITYSATSVARRLGYELPQTAVRDAASEGVRVATRQATGGGMRGGSEFSNALAQNLATPGPFTFIRSFVLPLRSRARASR